MFALFATKAVTVLHVLHTLHDAEVVWKKKVAAYVRYAWAAATVAVAS